MPQPAGHIAERVIAHVDLDAFFASVEQLLDPRLRGKPVVVGGAANQRGVVASASYEARARGIFVPMPLTRAYRIYPDAHFVKGHYDAYSDYSRQVFDICNHFSPRIEKASIDEGYLDWTRDQWRAIRPNRTAPRHWPVDLAEQLRNAVADETHLSVSVGIGANRLIAKIASKCSKPRGICHVARGAEQAFLAPLPLRAVPGIGPRSAAVLDSHALHRIGDVQNTSDEVLRARLGESWAEDLRRIADGKGRTTLELRGAPRSVSNERTFSRDEHSADTVRRTLYRLTEKAAWRLRRAGLKAGTVGVKLRTYQFKTHIRSKALGYRTDCHQELFAVANVLLRDLLQPMQPIRLVGIQLTGLDATSHRQLDLYDADDWTAARRAEQVLDSIRDRLGFAVIKTAGSL